MRFEFSTSGRIYFGPGILKEIHTIAPSLGKKAFLVTGKGGADPENLCILLASAGIKWQSFQESGEPTIDLIQQAVYTARENRCDFVIGFGGGSVLDTAKAVAVMLNNSGDLLDYLEVVGKNLPISNPGFPLIAIPTTAGTGSEVTRNAVISVPSHRVKVSMRSPYLLPKVALVDPELTYSLPPNVTASTGMDALTQVLEPYVSLRANALVDLYCKEGLSRVGRSLFVAYKNGKNGTAREDMAFTSLLGGLALANAGLGAVHGFAAPIGGMFEAPHGAVCACLLPPVTKVNISAMREREPNHVALSRYQEIARILVRDDRATVEDLIQWLSQIRAEMKIPGLAAYGVQKGDISTLVDMATQASSMKVNPIQLTREELTGILEQAL
jgi:alcohol dehydrogenase class IV